MGVMSGGIKKRAFVKKASTFIIISPNRDEVGKGYPNFGELILVDESGYVQYMIG